MKFLQPNVLFAQAQRTVFLYPVSGFLLGIGFIYPVLWTMGFVGIILFVLAVSKTLTWQKACLAGLMTYTIKALLVMSWVWTTYPIYWVDLGLGVLEIPVIGFYWFTIALFLGTAGIFCSLALWLSRKYLGSVGFLLLFPVLWVAAEILSAVALSFFTQGAGGTINTVFSFGSVGYLVAEHHWLLQLSALGGVYALSYFVVLTSSLIFNWLNKVNFNKSALMAVALGLLCLALSGQVMKWPFLASENQSETTVAIVDTELGGKDYFNLENREEYRIEQISEAFAAALQAKTDYIVMSEDSRVADPALEINVAYANLQDKYNDPAVVVVEAGAVPLLYGDMALRATIYDGINKTVQAVDKQYLVPQGEFMPYFYLETLNLFGLSEAAKIIKAKLPFKPGPLSSQAKLRAELPGVLFCFASADPLAVRKLLKERSLPFIAHPISHAWFNQPTVMWHQFDTMLRVHAVWNQVPIVSAGNMVKGALFTPGGEKIYGTVTETGEAWQVSIVSW